MRSDTFSFNVASHFVPAIVNFDYSALSADEAQQLAVFEAEQLAMAREYFGADFRSYHWSCDADDSGNYKTCEICGAYSDCQTLVMVCMLEGVKA